MSVVSALRTLDVSFLRTGPASCVFMTHQCCHGAALNAEKVLVERKQESKEGGRKGARKKDEEKGETKGEFKMTSRETLRETSSGSTDATTLEKKTWPLETG